MKISSLAFLDGDYLPSIYSYKGGNSSPPLDFIKVPPKAKSLCLIVHDPDAPSGDFLHWAVWNINPAISSIDAGRLPLDAVQGLNDFGNYRWDGPAPPSGTHRYVFELFAIDIQSNFDKNIDRQQLENEIDNHFIESAKIVGLYSK